ncbi:hypothetical protein C1930_16815 [Stenotrophomonas sp. SAU14A_NAIMI4_8]|nr:hypothetical protein C1930_16815 [Stenotrophomonas sp. SAU14A_NAIMI4_8]
MCRPRSTPTNSRAQHPSQLPPAAGICQRWGGVGLRGVSRMDAAVKPTWTYLRRPRNPTPPRHPTECSCCWCFGRCSEQVQGAALPIPPP